MTIKLLTPRGQYPVNAIVTFDAATEAALVADKVATTNLTGGTAYVAPAAGKTPQVVSNVSYAGGKLFDGNGNEITSLVSGAGFSARTRGDLLVRTTDLTNLTAVSGGLVSVATDYTFEGQPTLRFQSPSAGTTAGFQITGLSTRTRNSSFMLLVYVPDYSTLNVIIPYLSQGATLLPNYVSYSNYSLVVDSNKYNGLHLIEVSQDMWTAAGTGVAYNGTNAQVLRVDIAPRAGQIADVRIIGAWLNTSSTPSIMFTFDDGRLSQYNNAYPILNRYSIPTNCYIIPPKLGNTGASPVMTEAQAREIQTAGGTIGNHAYHPGGGGGDSYSEIGLSAYMAQVVQCRDWLTVHGFAGARHHAYVEGAYDQILCDAMAAAGMQTARCISGNTSTGMQSMSSVFGTPRRFALKGNTQLHSVGTVASYKAEIDRAIRDGRDLIFTGHDVFTTAEGGAGALAVLDTDFAQLAAYVAAYRANGQCKTPNLVDWYANLPAIPS